MVEKKKKESAAKVYIMYWHGDAPKVEELRHFVYPGDADEAIAALKEAGFEERRTDPELTKAMHVPH